MFDSKPLRPDCSVAPASATHTESVGCSVANQLAKPEIKSEYKQVFLRLSTCVITGYVFETVTTAI